jgi:hypothetical protein
MVAVQCLWLKILSYTHRLLYYKRQLYDFIKTLKLNSDLIQIYFLWLIDLLRWIKNLKEHIVFGGKPWKWCQQCLFSPLGGKN